MYSRGSKKTPAPFGYMPPDWMFGVRCLGRVPSQCAGKDLGNTQRPLKIPSWLTFMFGTKFSPGASRKFPGENTLVLL